MKVTLKRLNKDVLFEGANADGNTIQLDGSSDIGGEGKGMRPTESLLVSIAACSSIDVVLLLKKMRQQLDDINVEITGERAEDQVPKIFTKIHLHFILTGKIKEEKAAQAIEMSAEKYCTVAKMVDSVAEITHDFEIITS